MQHGVVNGRVRVGRVGRRWVVGEGRVEESVEEGKGGDERIRRRRRV